MFNHVSGDGCGVSSEVANFNSAGVGSASLGWEDSYFQSFKMGVSIGREEGADGGIGCEVEVDEQFCTFPFRDGELKRKHKARAKVPRNVEKCRANGECRISKDVIDIHAVIRSGIRAHESAWSSETRHSLGS